jgi:hypothetical protein
VLLGVRSSLDLHRDEPLRGAVLEHPFDAVLADERGVVLAFLDRCAEHVGRVDRLVGERGRIDPLAASNHLEPGPFSAACAVVQRALRSEMRGPK